MTSDKSREKVVEKKVSNTIKINPVLKDVKEETLNEVTLVEEYVVEADDVDTIADFVFEELIEEGFDAIEVAAALVEAKVTFGHDTKEPINKEGPKRVAKSMARIVRRKLKRKVGQKSAEMQVAAYNKGREIMRGAKDKARVAKQKLKRGIKKAALKVADKMSEGVLDQALKSDKKVGKLTKDTDKDVARVRKGGKFNYGKNKKEYPRPNALGIYEKSENVEELYKGKHGQSEKEYQDGRSDAGKMVSGDSKMSGSAYSSRATSSTGPNPAGGSKKPKGQGRMTSGARADLAYRKANLKKEEIEQLAANLQEKAMSCWKTHKKVGMKMKGGKLVNDCRPKSESVELGEDLSGTTATSPQMTNAMKQRATLDMKISQLRKQALQKDQSEKKPMKESEDKLRDQRMERGGVDGNVRYDKPAKNVATGGKKKSSSSSAFDFVKGELEKKYGKKAIISNKKG